MNDELLKIVLDCCQEQNLTLPRKISTALGLQAPLYGGENGVLDSIALVSLIVAVEQAVEEKIGRTVLLADARATSQKNSPFRSVESLIELIQSRLSESNAYV